MVEGADPGRAEPGARLFQQEWVPQPIEAVWFIEAPGKARHLEAILARLEVPARVQATKGHFMGMPSSLTEMGVDTKFHDHGRRPLDNVLYQRIRAEARAAGRVIIATDADAEGDVIAWDIAVAISDIHSDCLRVRLKALDDESILAALAGAAPVRKEDAIPGRTRALVDRAIGSAFASKGVQAGRVTSAMLGLVRRGEVAIEQMTLTADARSGGRPWRLTLPVTGVLDSPTARRLTTMTLPAMGVRQAVHHQYRPAHMGDVMIRASKVMGMKPRETAAAMQTAYETGRLSYPRSSARAMSHATARRLRKILKTGFDDTLVARSQATDTHDAPSPVGDFNPSHDPAKMGHVEGVRVLIGRDLVKCGQRHTREIADTSPLDAFLTGQGVAQGVRELLLKAEWYREQGPVYPGRESYVESGVETLPTETAILSACLGANLGRASTWSSHVGNFAESGLVEIRENALVLSDRGQALANRLPQELMSARLSSAIEGICDRGRDALKGDYQGREPWEVLAGSIIKALPASISGPILNELTPEIPREDFRHSLGPTSTVQRAKDVDGDGLSLHETR